jgi:hypothetical protein
MLDAIEPDGLVGDGAVGVAGVGDLDVMPGVGAPASRVAGEGGVQPDIGWSGGSSFVGGVVPRVAVAIALESVDDGLAVGHDLVHIELNVGDGAGWAGDVDPCVVEEVGDGRVASEDSPIAFASVVCELHGETACGAAEGRRRNDFGGAAGGAVGDGGIADALPGAEGLHCFKDECVRGYEGYRIGNNDDGGRGLADCAASAHRLDVDGVRAGDGGYTGVDGGAAEGCPGGGVVDGVAHGGDVLRGTAGGGCDQMKWGNDLRAGGGAGDGDVGEGGDGAEEWGEEKQGEVLHAVFQVEEMMSQGTRIRLSRSHLPELPGHQHTRVLPELRCYRSTGTAISGTMA